MNPIKTTLLILGFAITCNQLHADTYYKWIDDNGTTHYSSKPPKDRESSPVHTNSRASGPVSRMAPKEKQAANSSEQTEDGSTLYDAKANEEFCASAKDRLNLIISSNQVKQKSKDGNVVMLSEDQRQAEITRVQEQILEHCQ